MDFDSSLSEQDSDCLYGDDDEDIDSNFDEDYLLEDNEEAEPQQGSQKLSSKSLNHQDVDGERFHAYMDYSDVPCAQDYAEEEEDDEISLHPDDSLFDEEDDLGANNDRVRPR